MQVKEFNQMVIPFKDKLYRFALRIAGNQFDAEDIIQEVMLKLWKKRASLEEITNIEAWCMTVTRNMSIDWKRSKVKRFQEIENHTDIRDKNLAADLSLEQAELKSKVHSAINELPTNQREVIFLRDIEGYSYKEIAEITETSVDQIKVLIYRGRQRLKQMIIKKNIWNPKK